MATMTPLENSSHTYMMMTKPRGDNDDDHGDRDKDHYDSGYDDEVPHR